MGSHGDDAALVQDGDLVGEMQRRASMGDEQGRAAPHDPAQGGVDTLLHPGVDRARGVVENQDARVGEDRPGKRDALALASGKAEPPLSDDGVVTAGELLDEIVRLGRA